MSNSILELLQSGVDEGVYRFSPDGKTLYFNPSILAGDEKKNHEAILLAAIGSDIALVEDKPTGSLTPAAVPAPAAARPFRHVPQRCRHHSFALR